jgi:RNA-directed DNA polymerase
LHARPGATAGGGDTSFVEAVCDLLRGGEAGAAYVLDDWQEIFVAVGDGGPSHGGASDIPLLRHASHRWGKVKSLQRLLTGSRNGKLLAVRRVTENAGRKTSGVDGVSWDTQEKKMAAVNELKRRGYRPLPLRRIYIPKPNGKLRPLGIPTMKDRAMQALQLLALDPVAETKADENSYGFRQRRSCADAIEGCFKALARHPGWVLEGDIRGCFDNISHEWLMAHVPMDKAVLRKWLKSGYMEKQSFYATEQGTPQGGIISPVLDNLALDGLERRLRKKYPLRGPGSWQGTHH